MTDWGTFFDDIIEEDLWTAWLYAEEIKEDLEAENADPRDEVPFWFYDF